MGLFALSSVSLGAGFQLPFDATPATVRFGFSRRESPFSLTVSFLGGGGFFALGVSTRGVNEIEAALELGGSRPIIESIMGRALSGRGRRQPPTIEVVDEEMAQVLGTKTGAERLAIAAAMFRSARRMIESHLRAEHPEWDPSTLQAEVAHRIGHGAG